MSEKQAGLLAGVALVAVAQAVSVNKGFLAAQQTWQ